MGRGLYRFSKKAKEDLLALDVTISYSEIIGKVKDGVKVDHPVGRVQSGKYIFNVTNEGVIHDVSLEHLTKAARYYVFNCLICFDAKKVTVGDSCELCVSEGCRDCDEGLVFKLITCPNCVQQKIGDKENEWSNRNRITRSQSHGTGRPVPGQASRNSRRKTGKRDNRIV